MKLASISTRPPHLVQALEALAQRVDYQEDAENLIQELSGISVLVARKFTNDRTADGLLDAFYLTVGCVSLGLSQANIPDSNDSRLSFLLHHGAEHVFKMGFRHIKELSSLPHSTTVCGIDYESSEQQRNLKLLFIDICRADPGSTWGGDEVYIRELSERRKNQKTIDCAKWLRKKHYSGPVREIDLDAHAVIAIAVIFAMAGDAPIVARIKQEDLEVLIQGMRQYQLNVDEGWATWLKKVPSEYQEILCERMDQFKNTIAKKILSQSSVKSVLVEIQERYAGIEQDIEYA